MCAHPDQQIAFGRETLHTILHRVGNPDVPIDINRNSFGPEECSRTVTGLAKCRMKLPSASNTSIRLLNVSDIEVVVAIQRHIGGNRELAGLRQRVLLTGCADLANEVEFVGVVDETMSERASAT